MIKLHDDPLELVTKVAVSTLWFVLYRDEGEDPALPQTDSGAVSTATTTEIVPDPAGLQRYVTSIRITNDGAEEQRVELVVAGKVISRKTLAAGEVWAAGGPARIFLDGDPDKSLRGDGSLQTGGGGGAPTDASYLVGAESGGLSAERVVTDTATVAWDLGTAGQAKCNVPSATFDAYGDASAAVAAHVAAGDPHTAYQRESEKAQADGYASLDGAATVPVAQLPSATTTAKGAVELATSGENAANVAVQGNDSRLSDARTPIPTAGADTTAIHVGTASEISAITLKTTPTSSDLLVIEDVAAGNAKKRITIGTLPSGGGGLSSAQVLARSFTRC